MTRIAILLLCLAFAGCATPRARIDGDAARGVVVKSLGAEAKIAGPFSKEGKKELDVLTEADRATSLELLDQGAVGFLVYVPDYSKSLHTKDGPLMDMIKVGQIVFVLGDRVVGAFQAK